MKHTITIEGTFESEEKLMHFLNIIPDFVSGDITHKTDCGLCDGSGEVGIKGIYLDCKGCDGGTKI